MAPHSAPARHRHQYGSRDHAMVSPLKARPHRWKFPGSSIRTALGWSACPRAMEMNDCLAPRLARARLKGWKSASCQQPQRDCDVFARATDGRATPAPGSLETSRASQAA
eukprot:scaffold163136_cov32-Tisochrysis_lutea.AAC.5